jgi:DNA polymerase-3 subunit alpha
MGTLVLDDKSGRIEVTLFSEAYETHRDLLQADRILVVMGSSSYDEFRGGMSIRADQVLEFEQARGINARAIQLAMDDRFLRENGLSQQGFLQQLEKMLAPYRGGSCSVCLDLKTAGARALLEFGEEWRVNPTDELLRRLERFLFQGAVGILYNRGKQNL